MSHLNKMTRHHTMKNATHNSCRDYNLAGLIAERPLSQVGKPKKYQWAHLHGNLAPTLKPQGRPPIIIKSQTSERHGEAGIDMMDKEYPNNFHWSVDKTI